MDETGRYTESTFHSREAYRGCESHGALLALFVAYRTQAPLFPHGRPASQIVVAIHDRGRPMDRARNPEY